MEKYVELVIKTKEKLSQCKGKRIKKWANEKINQAGYDLLERIHQTIFAKKPQWEQDLIKADLELLAIEDKEIIVNSGRPELSDAYLKSIGRADLLNW